MPLLILLIIVAGGCVRTSDFDECEFPIRLQFCYTYNREGRDLLMEEVPVIDLLLYDSETGSLVKQTRIGVDELSDDGSFSWYVPMGHFNLLAWGGAESRYQILNGNTISEAWASLPSDSNGNVSHQREHLWHVLLTDILINGDITPVYVADMRKISNDVEVSVATTDGSDLQRTANAVITSANSLYLFNGQRHPEAPQVTYLPGVSSRSSDASFCYTTLGLSNGDGSGLKVWYGDDTIFDGSLTNLIAMSQDIDFDLDDEFKLDFTVTPGNDSSASVMVEVNGWKITDYDVSLHN